MMKKNIRIDWSCYHIVDEKIIHFPSVPIPIHLLKELKEIEFAGSVYFVPNPPEEYLSAKYGLNWKIPKKSGYEKDILEMVPDCSNQDILSSNDKNTDFNFTKIRIFNENHEVVKGALVRVVKHGKFKTDDAGYVKFILPEDNCYSLVISYQSHEELLYLERLSIGANYIYKPDNLIKEGRTQALLKE